MMTTNNDERFAESVSARPTGVDVIGEVPWSTHFCHFCETTEDLLDIPTRTSQRGSKRMSCVWGVVSKPLTKARARDALGRVMP